MQISILIVEDDMPAAEALARHLERQLRKTGALDAVEIRFEFATTLAAGLAKSQSCNATFLDLSLDVDAEEVIKSIRHFRKPVIVITGSDDPALQIRCVAAGALTVFVKPVLDNDTDIVRVAIDCIVRDLVANNLIHGA